MRTLLLLSVACLALLHAADPVPRGARVLAVDVSQAETGGYDAAWAMAAACGIQNVGLSLDWNQIETGPGTFSDPGGALAAANAYYPAVGATLTLTLRPLHNSVKPVPADLAATPFEDVSHVMATRFCAMLDWAMGRLTNVTIDALVIGSEYDVYLANHPSEWPDYGSFVGLVVSHVRASSYTARIPRIAAEATFSGYANTPSGVSAINGLCDVAGVSYYAIGAGFDTKDAATISADLASLLPFASASKPLCFYQFGCPSAWKDGGGVVHDRRAQQAAFISTAFSFWDAYADRVRLMDFTWLHDMSPGELAVQAAYFGSSDPAFLTFLASLGLREWGGSGTSKTGYAGLRQQAYARGWGDPVSGPGVGGSSASSGGDGGGGGGCGAGAAGAGLVLGAMMAASLVARRRVASGERPNRLNP